MSRTRACRRRSQSLAHTLTLCVAGAQDGNLKAAKATVPALHDKVRCVECRVQPNLGHKWPDEHMTYLRWWMGVMEGRFVPGEDMSFAWRESLEEALEIARPEKKSAAPSRE